MSLPAAAEFRLALSKIGLPLSALVSLVVGALLLIGGLAYLKAVDTETHAAVAKAIADREARSIQQFDAWFDEREKQAREWARRPETLALTRALLALPAPTPQALNTHPLQVEYRKLFATALGLGGLQGYFIVSPQGTSLGSYDENNTGTPNLLWQEPEFIAQMKSKGAALSPLMTSDVLLQNGGIALDGKPLTLFVGVPIYLDNNLGGSEPAAYYSIRIPPISLLAPQAQSRLGETGISYLVDRQGRLHADRAWLNLDLDSHGLHSEAFRRRRYLFARDPGDNLLLAPAAPADRSRLPLTRSALGVQQGPGASMAPYRDHRGVPVVGSWAWDDKLNLGVVTEMWAREAYAPIDAAQRQVLLAAVLLAVAAIAALLFGLLRSRRQLNSALIAAQAASLAKSSFLANMSHEIRTPMNAIIGLAHLMSRDSHEPRQRERLGKISGAAQHLQQVISDILDLSKIEADKLVLDETDFSLDELLSRCFEIVGERARDKGLELVLDTDHLPKLLRGDATRLSQMLINLLSNAVKFTATGWVCLRGELLRENGSELLVRFAVQDTGEGIARDRQALLFNAFEQADTSTTRIHGGTGLGLALTRQLAIAMGGEIGVDSEVGQGSSFWFTARLAHSGQPGARVAPVALKGLRALLVDDLPEALAAVVGHLEMLGLQVDALPSAAAAFDRVAGASAIGKRPYDVLLIDWRMEPVDGIEALRRLRAMLGADTPPSILVTASDDETVRRQALAERYDEVLVKPITASALHDALSRVLRAHPLATAPAPQADAEASEALLRRDHAGQRVLLVEDNPVNREVAGELLRMAGLAVETAENGAIAMEMALSRPYDLVLMDMQMPVMDGLEATRAIRARLKTALPIVAMTANAFSEDRAATLAAGMNAHVTKPVDPALLHATLLRWLPPQAAPREAAAPAAKRADPAPASRASLLDRLSALDGLDVSATLHNLGGQVGALERVLGHFARTYRVGQAVLLDSGNPDAVARWPALCHSVQGACAAIGAQALARLAEDIARDGGADPAALAARARTLHDDLIRFAERLAAELAS